MKVNREIFSERLKIIMNENNQTTYTMAEILHLTSATISRYQNNLQTPKITTIEIISQQFNINPKWLMGYDVEKQLKKPNFIKVPIIGKIACGSPLFTDENIVGYEYTEKDENIDFALIAKGDSMSGARIYDGDIIFVKKQDTVEDGDIAVILIDDEATLKRVYKLNGSLLLKAENPMYKDIHLSAKDRKYIKIIGKAISFKSNLR